MKHKQISEYTPGMPIKALILVAALLAAGAHVMGIRAFQGTDDIPALLIPIILLVDALLLWWAVIFTTQSKVRLYDDGIELQRGGSTLFTPWENVSHLGIRRSGRNRVSGLYLHEKAKPETKGFIDGLFFGRGTKFLPIGRYTRMPMTWRIINNEVDQEKLLRTDFGKELHELAPHLFEEYDEWKPKNQLRDDMYEDEQSYWNEDSQLNDEQHG